MKYPSFTPHKLTLFFLSFFLFFVLTASSTHAVVFESGIPGVGQGGAAGADVPSLVKYVSFLYVFVFGMVGIAGFISLVIWGTVWVATGIVDKKAMALESIKNTFIGIGIALTAYVILNTINPDLVKLSLPSATPIEPTTPSSVTSPTLPMVLSDFCFSLTGNRSEADKLQCKKISGCCWQEPIIDETGSGGSIYLNFCSKSPCK
ncbi:hypothetical protein A2Z10_00555 [Candidatus Azambacteria bacterium RBG_16_47_10]|uniref:P-type domain-containing protein n=1 Tax=Candidatus Azambacteria bacterium RBG_16_47_10 TaxID=1797292 RepID=A0A1F5AYQ7_9BACT|nr:MAG: hypothetical protein A2Z10_00555 [Candidatus Azambacteria bacterium RBG_16_47_10]